MKMVAQNAVKTKFIAASLMCSLVAEKAVKTKLVAASLMCSLGAGSTHCQRSHKASGYTHSPTHQHTNPICYILIRYTPIDTSTPKNH